MDRSRKIALALALAGMAATPAAAATGAPDAASAVEKHTQRAHSALTSAVEAKKAGDARGTARSFAEGRRELMKARTAAILALRSATTPPARARAAVALAVLQRTITRYERHQKAMTPGMRAFVKRLKREIAANRRGLAMPKPRRAVSKPAPAQVTPTPSVPLDSPAPGARPASSDAWVPMPFTPGAVGPVIPASEAPAQPAGVQPPLETTGPKGGDVVTPAVEPIEPVLEEGTDVVDSTGPVVEESDDVIDPVAAPVLEVAEPVLEEGSDVVDPVAAPVIEVAEPVLEEGTDVVDGTGPVVDEGTDVVDSTGPVLEEGRDVVDPATGPVIEVAEPVLGEGTDVVDPVAGPVTTTVGGLL